jgi:hypothetical protein
MSRLMAILTGGALSLFALGRAFAACLDASALHQGVVVTFADGSSTAVTRQDGDLLHLNHQAKAAEGEITPDGRDIRYGYFGVYPTLIDRLDGEHTLHIERTYEQPLPKPVPGLDFVVELNKVAGTKSGGIMTRFMVSEGPVLGVGTCTYATLIVDEQHLAKMAQADPPGSIHFVPDLGFGLPVIAEISAIELMR